jgi:tRNA pseudouridine38-40 synthase
MRTFKLTIAYDGTNYAGWQLQPDKPTIQEKLDKAIQKVTGRHSNTMASGRTDAGVHALGQVVGFRSDTALPPDVLMRAINANLPHDIAVLDAALAPDDFRPTHHALRKRYRYTIYDGPTREVFLRHYAWHYEYGRLDVDAMQRAAAALFGRHDFRSFQSSGAERKSSVRTILDLVVRRDNARRLRSPEGDCPDFRSTKMGLSPSVADDFITLEVEADGFLYNMVRAIVGTLIEVGRGARPESWPGEVLEAMDRRKAGPTAPPQGLCLLWVEY